MLQQVIDRFKRQRTNAFLQRTYNRRYAFVGMGQHSLTNLYPVLHYLGVPLKYICVTNTEKAALISRKYSGTEGTTDLDKMLADPEVGGVFVAASPKAHFTLAMKVLEAGKPLFIEKPPCLTLSELQTLAQTGGTAMVGVQKRYAPAVQILKKHLHKDKRNFPSLGGGRGEAYELHYATGAYPEGDALTDLYIHPLDLAVHLFGPAELLAARLIGANSYVLMLEHQGGAVGTLHLSTAHSWTGASERLDVTTRRGTYRLRQLETLTFEAKQPTLLGIPMEKVRPAHRSIEFLYGRNNFTPTPTNNQLVSQGFYDELLCFTELCEGRHATNLSTPESLLPTFRLMERMSDI